MKQKDPNFEKEIQALASKMEDDDYAKAFYRVGIDYIYGCSWRYAGGMVASMRYKGEDYLDFYCSGNEGNVRKDIEEDLNSLEYIPVPYKKLKGE